MGSNVVGLHGVVAPTGEVNPEVVEQIEKLLEMAASGEIVGIQAVVLHRDMTAVSLWRRGHVNYAMVGLLTAAAQSSIADLEKADG